MKKMTMINIDTDDEIIRKFYDLCKFFDKNPQEAIIKILHEKLNEKVESIEDILN
jgi:activator of 2-hydroxyglutaryl-CoA dehydratase